MVSSCYCQAQLRPILHVAVENVQCNQEQITHIGAMEGGSDGIACEQAMGHYLI
jgi:hypothetical protein